MQCLAQVEDCPASEFFKENLFGHLFSQFAFGVYLASVTQADLHILVFHFAVGHYRQVLIDFAVALVRVHDYVEILVRAEHLGQNVTKRLFKHIYHRGFVDVLQFLELGKPVYHVCAFIFFCHADMLGII